jgi:hypothetical protein
MYVLSFSQTNIVLKDNPINRNKQYQQSSTRVAINGGTICYQAPELFQRKAKFSRRADVFAAGVIFLELLTLQKPNTLYDDLYPGILKVKLPAALLTCFARSLDSDPEKRMQFSDLLHLLRSKEGKEIRNMELGMTKEFDDAAADLQLLMPSSRYNSFHFASTSSSGNQYSSDTSSSYQASSFEMVKDKSFGTTITNFFKGR